MKSKFKDILDKVALIAGFGLILGFMNQGFRESLGATMNYLFRPLIVFDVYIVIFILAAITGLYTSLMQKYTIDWEKTRRATERMKQFQKEFKEAQLSENKHKLKKLEEERGDIMAMQAEMSKQQLKPMAYIMLVTLPVFGWLYYLMFTLNPTAEIVLPFYGLKILATDKVLKFIPVWIFWYALCSMSVSQIIRKTLNMGGA